MFRTSFLIILLLLLCPPPAGASRIWVDPAEVSFTYSANETIPEVTVSVSNFDMDTEDFVWSVSAEEQWVKLGGSAGTRTGSGTFTISLQADQLANLDNGRHSTLVTVLSDIGKAFVTVNLDLALPKTEVREDWISTSSWLDLRLNIPGHTLPEGDHFYVLMEHPTLLPGQVYAYRCLPESDGRETDCRFDLFSWWGRLVSGAESLHYDSDRTLDLQNDEISVPFGGFRLIGVEGDLLIHCLVGKPQPGEDWGMGKLLEYTLHIVPLTGDWSVTDIFEGKSFSYPSPLTLYESLGQLQGSWNGHAVSVNYVNSDDLLAGPAHISGTRVDVVNASTSAGYDIFFKEWQPATGTNLEYWYRISNMTLGSLEGIWRYRSEGTEEWSIPYSFSAVLNSVTVPFDSTCNCYRVTGSIKGTEASSQWATNFIVDTGASLVTMDLIDAERLGVSLGAPVMLQTANGEVQGNLITLAELRVGNLVLKDVQAIASPGLGAGEMLLGNSFLNAFNVVINPKDGSMTIGPAPHD